MKNLTIETIEPGPNDAAVAVPENRPFVIHNREVDNRTGILLVHGFTGTPWEMRDLGLRLARSCRMIIAVRLPGHGTSAEDLAGKSCEQWLAAVTDGYRLLAADCDRIVGAGLSTGALLLLAAAGQLSFTGLVLLSPYLKLRHLLSPLAGLLRYVIPYSRRPLDVGVSPYYYQDRPLAGVYQINRLIRQVKKNLASIDCPSLVACAAGDITVRSSSAITLYNRLNSCRKEYYRFGREVPHVLTTADNPKQQEMLQIASEFVNAVVAD